MGKRVVVILVLAAVISIGVLLFETMRKGFREDLNVIRISGNIEVTDAEVSFKIPGRVEARLVSEGETCKAGQIVARLDSRELSQETGLRQAEVQAAHAVLAELEAGFRPEEIAQARAGVSRAAAEANRLKADHARQLTLYRKDVISTREYEASRSAYEVAAAKVREATEQLNLLEAGPRREKIDQARAELERAEKTLALAQTRLGYATLVSPLSGIVLSENVEAGEYVAAGTPVVTVGDLRNVWLRGYIDETDLGRVQLKQEVRVTTDTYPGKQYRGQVSFIAPQAEFTPKNVQTQKERVKLVYRVKVDLENPDLELKPGMPADAEIILDRVSR